MPKNVFAGLFLSKTLLRRKKFDQNKVFLVNWECSKNQIFETFLKPPLGFW